MTFLQCLFSFKGRINRTQFWTYTIGIFIILIPVGGICIEMEYENNTPLTYAMGIAGFILIYMDLAVVIKRLHDTGRSGVMALIGIVPCIGVLYLVIVCGIFKGDTEKNYYGDIPDKIRRSSRRSCIIVFLILFGLCIAPVLYLLTQNLLLRTNSHPTYHPHPTIHDVNIQTKTTPDDVGIQIQNVPAPSGGTIDVPPDKDETTYNRAVEKALIGQMNEAILDFDTVIRLNPDYAPAYYNRGLAKRKINDLTGAISDYNVAITLNPSYVKVYYNRSLVRYMIDDLSGAISDCNKVIQLEPTYALAYNSRGLVKRKQGDIAGALSDYDTSIRLDPTSALPYNNRAFVKIHKGLLDEATSDLDTAIQLEPTYAQAYYNRAIVMRKLGRTFEAKQDYHTALKLTEQAGDIELTKYIKRILIDFENESK